MAIWIVLHEYPEGASPYLVRSGGKPTQAQAKKIVKDYKPRADSGIRVIGPYNEKTIIDLTKKKRKRVEKDLPPALEDLPLTGTKCSVCKEPQYQTPSGDTCKNGHGGAPALVEETSEEPDDLDPYLDQMWPDEEDFDPFEDD